VQRFIYCLGLAPQHVEQPLRGIRCHCLLGRFGAACTMSGTVRGIALGVQEPGSANVAPPAAPSSAVGDAPSDFGQFGDRGAVDRYWAASQTDKRS